VAQRIPVLKTYKLFINGAFPRSESGRSFPFINPKGVTLAHVARASAKDFRNAVVAARGAAAKWAAASAFNRSQVIYRIAEMLESRGPEFVRELVEQGMSRAAAAKEVGLSLDRVVHYAGWCDKFQQVFSTVNPVASPHYNFSVPEPTGVVSIIAPEKPGLLGFLSVMLPVVAGGNTCVVLASGKFPLSALTFGEVLATSDVPAGVINILAGEVSALHGQFSSHMDVNAMIYCGDDPEVLKACAENCAMNVKRFHHWVHDWNRESGQGPY
jgi:acyl-CoA reductase-like NAD-dependent aldehyde dehydrogenase